MCHVLEAPEQFVRFRFLTLKASADIGVLNPLFAATDKKKKTLSVAKLALTLLEVGLQIHALCDITKG